MPLPDAERLERLNRRLSPAGTLLGPAALALDSAAGAMRIAVSPRRASPQSPAVQHLAPHL